MLLVLFQLAPRPTDLATAEYARFRDSLVVSQRRADELARAARPRRSPADAEGAGPPDGAGPAAGEAASREEVTPPEGGRRGLTPPSATAPHFNALEPAGGFGRRG